MMSVFAVPIWLPLLLLLPILLLMKDKIHGRRQNKNLPPSPPYLPIIGNMHLIGNLPHQSLSRLAQRYGPVMLLKFGAKPIVVISSAEAAKEVLKVHDLDCCSRPLSASAGKLTYNYQDIVFAPYGEYWREIRKVCVLELFSAARVQSFRSIREEEVALLVNSISQSSSSATHVNLLEKMLPPTDRLYNNFSFYVAPYVPAYPAKTDPAEMKPLLSVTLLSPCCRVHPCLFLFQLVACPAAFRAFHSATNHPLAVSLSILHA